MSNSLWHPWTAAHQASLSITNSQSLLKLMSIDAIQPSHPLSSPFPPAFNLSQHQVFFQMSRFFVSGGQGIRVSALASVISMNIQGWFPSGWTGLISSQSNRLSRVFSSTTVWKHQFFGAQPSSWSSHLKKDEILPFVRPRMDLEDIMLNKSGGEGQILYDFIYVWNIKNQ